MGLNAAGIDLATQGTGALKSGLAYAQIHTANPPTSSNEATSSRVAVSWTDNGSGVLSLSSTLAFTGGASGGAAASVGFWSASTAGTFYGGFATSGDTTFNSAGDYNVTAVSITGSSTG